MKGDKKKSHKFKKGNVPWNKGISTHCADYNEACVDSSDVSDPTSTQIKANRTVRMTEEEYYLVTNKSRDGTSRTMPDCGGSTSSTGSTRLLRPARTPSSDLKTDRKAQDTGGMRLVDNDKMVESWNTAYRLHRQESSQCELHQQFTGLIMIQEHLQLRNVKVRVLSCQHGRRELCDHLMLRQNIPEIMLRDQKLLNINSFNTVTKFKNIRNISV